MAVVLARFTLGSMPHSDQLFVLSGQLLEQGKIAAAEVAYLTACRMYSRDRGQPFDEAAALYNLGHGCHERQMLAPATRFYRRALAIKPTADAYNNLASALMGLKCVKEALAVYDKAAEAAPTNAAIRTGRATALLLSGDLERGFQEYEWRLLL